nr:helix-turn-helix domain-containing protein [Sphingomonas bacterium]
MPRAYSDDLRVRVVRAVDAGASRRSVATKFEVSVSFVIRLVAQWRASGSAKVRGTGGRPRHRLEPHGALVDRLLAAHRDVTLDELRAALADEGVSVSRSGVDRYLKARGLTRKKRQRTPLSRSAPTSPQHARLGASSRAN